MGLDLTLLPFDGDHGDFCFSHTLLDCGRRRDLFDAIMETLHEVPVPDGFQSYMSRDGDRDSHYGVTTTTPYGQPLGWVRAADLAQFSAHADVLDNYKNKAVWAYLGHLPPRTKVALYWH